LLPLAANSSAAAFSPALVSASGTYDLDLYHQVVVYGEVGFALLGNVRDRK
jgi:hypothetical protein